MREAASGPITAMVLPSLGFQRQKVVVVLEQHHGFARCPKREASMFGRVHDGERNRRVRHASRRIEHAQLHARGEETLDRDIDLGLGDQFCLHRVGRAPRYAVPQSVSVPASMPAAEPVAWSVE